MKKYLLVLTVVIGAVACNSNKTANTTENETAEAKVLTVPGLLEQAETLLDKEIVISGLVDHVCSHSGRRCFLVDSIADKSIKVEAGGEIETFDKEILGNVIVVTGILKEQQLMAAEIDEWEVKLKEEHGEDLEEGGEKCASELANINSMREWMKEHNKDYYAIYYVDGLKYEVVE